MVIVEADINGNVVICEEGDSNAATD